MKTVVGIYPAGQEPIELLSADPHRLIARNADELQEIRAEIAGIRRLLLKAANKPIGRDNMDYQAPTRAFREAAI